MPKKASIISTRNLALLLCLGLNFLTAACRGNSSAVPCYSALLIDLQLSTDGDGPDPVISAVQWIITADGMTPMVGRIDTSAPGATPSVEVFGLAPGNYEVALEANSDDGKTHCRGEAPFDVSPGLATEVAVLLNCSAEPRFGAVRVNGKLNICPELTKAVVAPLQTSIGNRIAVRSHAEDPEGDTVQYAWTATSGSFANPSAANTFYTCEQTGDHAITISATDDGAEHCIDTWTVDITCINNNGSGGTGGSGASGGMGGVGGMGASGGTGGMGATGGIGGSGATGGAGGTGGIGGTGATGGAGGIGGTGGSGTAGSGGVGGTSGTGGDDGAICEITVSLSDS